MKKLTHREVVVLIRAALKYIPHARGGEAKTLDAAYHKLTEAFVDGLPRSAVRRVGAALAFANGEYSR